MLAHPRHRIFITVSLWLTYLLLFNFYIYQLTHGLSIRRSSLLYNYITLGSLIFCFIDRDFIVSGMHRQFNTLYLLSLIANFILIILTHHVILTNPEEMFYTFNGLIFAVTTMIVISSYRHGHFKD